MKNYTYIYRIQGVVLLCSLLFAGVFLSSCKDDDEKGTSDVTIISFGPSQLLAGEELKFIGTNLDQVSAVVLPGGVEITDFASKSKSIITVVLPEGIADGAVTLKSSQGDIVTSTPLGIGRPIEVNSFTPATAKPGAEVTLTGNFLNLVGEVIFSNGKSVTDFVSQSKTSLKVVVPRDAQTGLVSVIYTPSESWKDPEEVDSDVELGVSLPAVTSASPSSVKPGGTLTLTGTNLDLTDKVLFVGGGSSVLAVDFISVSATSISLKVPDNAEDGGLVLTSPSFLEVTAAAVTMVKPTVTAASPMSVNMNENLIVTGTNLDLITSVSFADGSSVDSAAFVNKSATSIELTVTTTATDGAVTLNTESSVTASTAALAIISPTITGGLPITHATTVVGADQPTLVLTGTGFDDVASAAFAGVDTTNQWAAEVNVVDDNNLSIVITAGSVSGKVILYATNGEAIVSASDLTITANVPNVTGMPSTANAGDKLTLTGTNMDVDAQVYFEGAEGGDLIVTRFGAKTSTLIELYIPSEVATGEGKKVKFVTFKNEVYYTDAFDELTGGLLPLDVVVFDESTSWGVGGGWGGTTTDVANTELARTGTVSIKATHAGGYGAGPQLGRWGQDPVSLADVTTFVFSAYGGPGTDGLVLIASLKDDGADWVDQNVTLVEGKWTDYEIPIADFAGSPSSLVEMAFKDNDWSGDVYIDYVGFR